MKMQIALLALVASATAAQGLPKPLTDYKFAQTLAFSNCSTDLMIARINADTARIKGTTAPSPSTVAFDCIKRAEVDVKARYVDLAAGVPERDREGLLNIQVAWMTAIRAMPSGPGERTEFPALRAKFDEAWNRWEATH
jgi:hypothetical protein